jgi:hypothetical protein
MAGVTTAIVAFVFVCIIFPHLVKNRPQFYAAFTAVLVAILLDSLAHILQSGAFYGFAYAMAGVLQVSAIVLLFLSAGGLTWRELGGDMRRAFEVIRRGEEEKEIIIPLTGQMPKKKTPPSDEDAPAPRVEINDPKPQAKPDSSSLPIE